MKSAAQMNAKELMAHIQKVRQAQIRGIRQRQIEDQAQGKGVKQPKPPPVIRTRRKRT